MIPNELGRDHVLAALDRIVRDGMPRKRASREYCLVHDGMHFAPKYVISEACRGFTPGGLDPRIFNGGRETNDTLQDLGFDVQRCSCGGLVSPMPAGA